MPPATADVAGWLRGGPEPGDRGPALLAGHVDSRKVPGVFYRLGELRIGDRIDVQRADGMVVTFAVSWLNQVAKVAFPVPRKPITCTESTTAAPTPQP